MASKLSHITIRFVFELRNFRHWSMIMEKVALNGFHLIDLKNSTIQCHLGNLSEQQCPFI